jgi:hypothetical protein
VTAMWCSPRTALLVSSGDDGLLHLWQPASWGGRSAPTPLRSVDMNKWVSADMRGPPLRSMSGVPPLCLRPRATAPPRHRSACATALPAPPRHRATTPCQGLCQGRAPEPPGCAAHPPPATKPLGTRWGGWHEA